MINATHGRFIHASTSVDHIPKIAIKITPRADGNALALIVNLRLHRRV